MGNFLYNKKKKSDKKKIKEFYSFDYLLNLFSMTLVTVGPIYFKNSRYSKFLILFDFFIFLDMRSKKWTATWGFYIRCYLKQVPEK